MATTSPDNLRTPDPGDPYNLVPDLATFAGDVQAALILRDNTVQSGTASQRTAFTSSATDGWLWQDTDGIKMIWRKDGAAWVPAVWRWSGTTTQMNAFAAPNGFEWFNTTDNTDYVRLGGAWKGGWLTCTRASGIAIQSSQEPMVRLSRNMLEFRWGVAGTGITAGVSRHVMTLPSGLEPDEYRYATAMANSPASPAAHCVVQATGNVVITPNATANYFMFDGLQVPFR